MHKDFTKLLVCPVCNGKLEFHNKDTKLLCEKDNVYFPVRKGVPVLLKMDAVKSESNNE